MYTQEANGVFSHGYEMLLTLFSWPHKEQMASFFTYHTLFNQ